MLQSATIVVLILVAIILIIVKIFNFTDAKARKILFWGVCIPIRSLIVIAAKERNIAPLTALFAIGFGSKFVREENRMNRQREAGEVVDFGKGITGGDVYWHDIRLIHSGMYALYSLFADVPGSYLILATDLFYSMAANIKYR
jgi:hypothetical protein